MGFFASETISMPAKTMEKAIAIAIAHPKWLGSATILCERFAVGELVSFMLDQIRTSDRNCGEPEQHSGRLQSHRAY